jgi:hypothetical protein
VVLAFVCCVSSWVADAAECAGLGKRAKLGQFIRMKPLRSVLPGRRLIMRRIQRRVWCRFRLLWLFRFARSTFAGRRLCMAIVAIPFAAWYLFQKNRSVSFCCLIGTNSTRPSRTLGRLRFYLDHWRNVTVVMVGTRTQLTKDHATDGRRPMSAANDAFSFAGRFVDAFVAIPKKIYIFRLTKGTV